MSVWVRRRLLNASFIFNINQLICEYIQSIAKIYIDCCMMPTSCVHHYYSVNSSPVTLIAGYL